MCPLSQMSHCTLFYCDVAESFHCFIFMSCYITVSYHILGGNHGFDAIHLGMIIFASFSA